ncbi:MAG: methionine biosynthesis protein MetW [bacterium]|nr:methionine biosynthesis protein MetW [bacterium]
MVHYCSPSKIEWYHPSGMEIAVSWVAICAKRDLPVTQRCIESDNSFVFTVCNAIIQIVMNPEVLLREMKRISRCQIISFPNFYFFLAAIGPVIYRA